MNNNPGPVLEQYIAWFSAHGPGPSIAHASHHIDLAAAIGMDPTLCEECIYGNVGFDFYVEYGDEDKND